MPAKSGPNSSDNKGKKERILIFSAGANIHNTYRSSYNKILPTKVYVLVEKAVLREKVLHKEPTLMQKLTRKFAPKKKKLICDYFKSAV